MGVLRRRIDKVEQEAEAYFNVLVLPDGERVRYTTDDVLAALNCAIRGEEHWFVDAVLRAGTREGLLGLVWAIDASHKRIGAQDDDHDQEPNDI